MLAIFCLRLGLGLLEMLFLLSPAQINPRFFRTQFITVLGLLAAAAIFLREVPDLWLWLVLGGTMVLAFLGSMVWLLEGAPGSRMFMVLTFCGLCGTLVLARPAWPHSELPLWLWADDLASATLLGSALTAMLLGHSYLIAPAMSLTPLFRLLAVLAGGLLLRLLLAGVGLWLWTGQPGDSNLETETVLWLAGRWVVGFLVPLILTWMATATAKIRSTQSATGILYVVVIMCFLGELLSQLLLDKTGFIL